MNQNIWGPHMWHTLHVITLNYPIKPLEEDKKKMNTFLIILQDLIPCSVCKRNYIRHLKESPPLKSLNNRKDYVYWMIDLHNKVNSETGKKIYDYDIIINRYNKIYGKKFDLDDNNNNNNTNIINKNNKKYNLHFLLFIFIIIIFFFILYK